MNAKRTILAFAAAAFSLGAAEVQAQDSRTIRNWVSHADAVFAQADAANLAAVAEHASRQAWVSHAEAVFAAADAETWRMADSLDLRAAGRGGASRGRVRGGRPPEPDRWRVPSKTFPLRATRCGW